MQIPGVFKKTVAIFQPLPLIELILQLFPFFPKCLNAYVQSSAVPANEQLSHCMQSLVF